MLTRTPLTRRFRRLLETGPAGPFQALTRTVRQAPRRLSAEDLEVLKQGYLAGMRINDLAKKHGIYRLTVMEHVGRMGRPRRYPCLNPDDVTRASALYRSGQSLLAVAEVFGVAPHTVRSALLRVGVSIRRRNGR